MLPRLPDTSDELKSIALALQADPSKVLNLGKQATDLCTSTLSQLMVQAYFELETWRDYVDSLTESEREQYYISLNGDPSIWEGSEDEDFMSGLSAWGVAPWADAGNTGKLRQ